MTGRRRQTAAATGPFAAPVLCALAALILALPTALPTRGAGQTERRGATEPAADTRPEQKPLSAPAIALEEGTRLFSELHFEEAVRRLGEAIDGIGEGDETGPRSPEATALLCRALDLRAQALLSLGRATEAGKDMEALVRADPSYRPDERTVSPKIIGRFDAIRAKLVGFLNLFCDPADSAVDIDGREAGVCPLEGYPLLAGDYTISAGHKGFDTGGTGVTVVAGETVSERLVLTPNARSVVLRTRPAGVEVVVDDLLAGVTVPDEGAVIGLSAPLVIEALPPGDHRFEFRKECYVPQIRQFTVVVDLMERYPVEIRPVELAEARSSVTIRSDPPGGLVSLDGESLGRAPIAGHSVCAGERLVEVSFGEGIRWMGRIDVAAGGDLLIEARPRPDLVWAIVPEEDTRSPLSRDDAAALEELQESLRAIGSFNLDQRRPGGGNMVAVGVAAGPSAGESLRSPGGGGIGSGAAPPGWRLDPPAEPPGLALEVGLHRTGSGVEAAFSLRSPFHAGGEVVSFGVQDREGWRRYIRRLDEATAFDQRTSGLILLDTQLVDGPVVLAVRSGSPAARAGVRAGDRIVGVAGEPAGPARSVRDRLLGTGAGESLTLELRSAGGARTVAITPETTPIVIPLAGERAEGSDPVPFSYHKAAVEARLAASTARQANSRGLALINLAAALMHFDENRRVIDEVLPVIDLPEGPGVSRGTVSYMKGIAWERLGKRGEAAAAFEAAAASPEATIDGRDGVAIAPGARLRAERLRRTGTSRSSSGAPPPATGGSRPAEDPPAGR